MRLSSYIDEKTGLPKDQSYFECDLPPFLLTSIEAVKNEREKLTRGEEYFDWDCDFCDLQSSINVAETEQIISPEQAWHLREKYLGLRRVQNVEDTPYLNELQKQFYKTMLRERKKHILDYSLTALNSASGS